MRCDTCGKDSDSVLRVVIAKDYNRSLARPIFNCPDCFAKKEQAKTSQQRPSPQRGGTQGTS